MRYGVLVTFYVCFVGFRYYLFYLSTYEHKYLFVYLQIVETYIYIIHTLHTHSDD